MLQGNNILFLCKEVQSGSTGSMGQHGTWAEFPLAFKILLKTCVAILIYMFCFQRSATLSGLNKHLLTRCPGLGQKH